MIRVVVADDQELVRDGLSLILQSTGKVDVVGRAADGLEAVALARRLHPDVLLMDIRMPAMDGLTATELIAREAPDTRVLVLTTYDVDEYVLQALRAGAAGYLLKDTPRQAMIAAISAAAAGDVLLDPAVVHRLVSAGQKPTPPPEVQRALDRLTPREREVLTAVSRGWSNSEIAAALFVTEATVKTHIARLLDKLHARDRIQLVVLTHTYGLANPA